MADNDYEDYNKELINDIDIRANSEGIQSNECYFDIINEMLTEIDKKRRLLDDDKKRLAKMHIQLRNPSY